MMSLDAEDTVFTHRMNRPFAASDSDMSRSVISALCNELFFFCPFLDADNEGFQTSQLGN